MDSKELSISVAKLETKVEAHDHSISEIWRQFNPMKSKVDQWEGSVRTIKWLFGLGIFSNVIVQILINMIGGK